eukprot:789659-Pyramimonas_sp.AAC.1
MGSAIPDSSNALPKRLLGPMPREVEEAKLMTQMTMMSWRCACARSAPRLPPRVSGLCRPRPLDRGQRAFRRPT